jgi:hypothetical protein
MAKGAGVGDGRFDGGDDDFGSSWYGDNEPKAKTSSKKATSARSFHSQLSPEDIGVPKTVAAAEILCIGREMICPRPGLTPVRVQHISSGAITTSLKVGF